jgi:hypothetical protein
VSDAVDKHIAKAFASLDDLPIRELETTAEALSRRHVLHAFAGLFREVAWCRESGSDPHLARYHAGDFVAKADDDVLALLGQAEAPFWGHVREAILACRIHSPD